MFNLDKTQVIGLIVLLLMTVFLTGPGLWSENWGFKWLDKLDKKKPPKKPDPPAS